MNRGLSLYFDFARLAAALEVLVYHLRRFPTIGLPAAWWNAYGHEAVTVFFVLSGYLITYAARERDRGLGTFIVSRATRIFSVAVPAVLLTFAFDWIGRHLAPGEYAPFAFDAVPLRLLTGLTLTSQSWVDIQMFSNSPFWSVAYEFWHYALFAASAFLRGRVRLATLAIVALIAGPKILLLYPIWLMGSWAYRQQLSERLPRLAWVALAVLPLLGMWAYADLDLARQSGAMFDRAVGPGLALGLFHYSNYVISDTLLGILVTAHFIGMRHLAPAIEPLLARFKRPIRFGANYSFSLYALHQPAILLGLALFGARIAPPWMPVAIVAFVIAVVLGIGTLTERRRERLRPILATLYARVAARLGGVLAMPRPVLGQS